MKTVIFVQLSDEAVVFIFTNTKYCLHCFDAVGWAAGRASGL